MRHSEQKNSAINIRIHAYQKSLIDRAALLSNKSRSDFMLESACKEAENVLLDQKLFFIDDKAYQAFIELLEKPVDENLGLQALLKSKSPWEK